MNQERHRHLGPIKPRTFADGGSLPKNEFGVLVGTLDHVALDSTTDEHSKDHEHLFIWLYVNSGPSRGLYECAVPTQPVPGSNEAMFGYCVADEELTPVQVPSPGWRNAEISYEKLQLGPASFNPVGNGRLRSIMIHNAERCDLIAAYGWTYREGTGVHRVHQGAGNRSRDGAIAFYFRAPGELPFRRWFFLHTGPAKTVSRSSKRRS
jgi:hypothetical protein